MHEAGRILEGAAVRDRSSFTNTAKIPTRESLACRCRNGTSLLMAFLALQLSSIGYYYYYVNEKGYLPSPFIHDKFDTFMDLYNTMYWVEIEGRYTDWGSVYPPINFLILRIIEWLSYPVGLVGRSPDIRAENLSPALGMVLLHLVAPIWVVAQRGWADFSMAQRGLIAAITSFSPIFLFSAERANLIILALFLLPWLFSEDSEDAHPWILAILINLKPYFALLLLAYLFSGDLRRFLQATAISGSIFLATGLLLDPNFPVFIGNIASFAGNESVLSGRGVLSVPASLSAFSYAINSYMKMSQAPGLHESILAAMPSLIEGVKWITLSFAVFALYAGRITMKVTEAFFLLLLITINAGVWAGGYSQIFYLAAVPVLFRTEHKLILLSLALLIFLPLDLITLHVGAPEKVASFLFAGELPTSKTLGVVEMTWQLGLGSFVRPILNTILILVFSSMLIFRARSTKNREITNHV